MVGLFSTASKESQIGVDFLRNGVAVAPVLAASNTPGSQVRAEFIEANGQEAQVEALRKWVRSHRLPAIDIHDLALSNLPAVRESAGQNLVLSTLSTRKEWIEI